LRRGDCRGGRRAARSSYRAALDEVAVEVEDSLELLVRGRVRVLPDARQERLFTAGEQGYGEV
jgi:hypothetical protein